MALSKTATPEEIREYRRKRRLAWAGIFLCIGLGIFDGVVYSIYGSGLGALAIGLFALITLLITAAWASNQGVL